MIAALFVFVIATPFVHSCQRFEVSSSHLPPLVFNALPASETAAAGFTSGRAVYKHINDTIPLYMYHTVAEPSNFGIGRWVLSQTLGAKSEASAFVDSWAVMPNLVHAVNDPYKSIWKVHTGQEWTSDPEMVVRCIDTDNTVYVEVGDFAWPISGFYVQNGETENGAIFSHVHANDDVQLYLYKTEQRWIIGEKPGELDGVAFVIDSAEVPSQISKKKEWNYAKDGSWTAIPTTLISGNSDLNIFARLRDHRTIAALPTGQSSHRLRNELVIPAIGLGTGRVAPDKMEETMYNAMSVGYRMFDLARAYGNEEYMGSLLAASSEGGIPPRFQFFLISKVWPTHLGFSTTSREISQSLGALRTPYIDLYMIHWPWCNPEFEWMHCENTVDKEGLWIQSYMALEKAYAEGRISSLGVSNFDIKLLLEMAPIVNIVPHVVQNFAEVGNMDLDMRVWCNENGVVFMPYGTQQDLSRLHDEVKKGILDMARNHGVSPHAIITRYFLQTGAAMIPRSTQLDHMRENLETVMHFQLGDDEMQFLGWRVEGRHSDEL